MKLMPMLDVDHGGMIIDPVGLPPMILLAGYSDSAIDLKRDVVG